MCESQQNGLAFSSHDLAINGRCGKRLAEKCSRGVLPLKDDSKEAIISSKFRKWLVGSREHANVICLDRASKRSHSEKENCCLLLNSSHLFPGIFKNSCVPLLHRPHLPFEAIFPVSAALIDGTYPVSHVWKLGTGLFKRP